MASGCGRERWRRRRRCAIASSGVALFGPAGHVPLADAAGRIAAEVIAPAPPGVPRLVPGQRIAPAHVAWLLANRDMGAFFLDPTGPSELTVRAVRRS